MIKPGRMRHRIIIQQSTQTQNAYGEPVDSWSAFSDPLWAEVSPVQGREFWAQQQAQSEVTHRVRVRYVPGVTTAMRVMFGSRIFAVKSVIDVKEEHKELQLMCREGVEES